MANHIATSPLTGRIHLGRVSKDRTHFVGEKQDVTSDVFKALIDKAEFHGGAFVIEGGERKWLVTVKEQSAYQQHLAIRAEIEGRSHDD